jgi:hypothetical protein
MSSGHKWKPLERATCVGQSPTAELLGTWMGLHGCDEATALSQMEAEFGQHEYWITDLYQVELRRDKQDWTAVHLVIRRRDGYPNRDWRHFQQIKRPRMRGRRALSGRKPARRRGEQVSPIRLRRPRLPVPVRAHRATGRVRRPQGADTSPTSADAARKEAPMMREKWGKLSPEERRKVREFIDAYGRAPRRRVTQPQRGRPNVGRAARHERFEL